MASTPERRYARSGGLGLEFADRGVHQLNGVPGEWRLLAANA